MLTLKISLYKGKTLKDGSHPVCLRAAIGRAIRYITITESNLNAGGISAKPAQWDFRKDQFRSSHPGAARRNARLVDELQRAMKLAETMADTLQAIPTGRGRLVAFRDAFAARKEAPRPVGFVEYFAGRLATLKANGKTGNAEVYGETLRSWQRFNRGGVGFDAVTPKTLHDYENHLRQTGAGLNTISVRMRTIRAVFNHAVRYGSEADGLGDVLKAVYPFDRFTLKHLKTVTPKRALSRDDVRKIEAADLHQHPGLMLARDLFIFSYYARGINFADLITLEKKDLENGRLLYRRKKTGKLFSIKLLPVMAAIIEAHPVNPAGYIFPVLARRLDGKPFLNAKKRALKKYNAALNELAALCGIVAEVTSYTARHSFASNLKRANVSTDVISELLGHSEKRTTEIYLESFENENLDRAVDRLLG